MTATLALDSSQRRRRGQIYVALAAVAWSTAGVLQRQLDLDTATQVFGRAVFAALALLAYVAVVERGQVARAFRSVGLAGVAVALCVATASAGFIAALNHASVARVLFLLAASPVMAALLARVVLGEPITRRTASAMAPCASTVDPCSRSLTNRMRSIAAGRRRDARVIHRHTVSSAHAGTPSTRSILRSIFTSTRAVPRLELPLAGG